MQSIGFSFLMVRPRPAVRRCGYHNARHWPCRLVNCTATFIASQRGPIVHRTRASELSVALFEVRGFFVSGAVDGQPVGRPVDELVDGDGGSAEEVVAAGGGVEQGGWRDLVLEDRLDAEALAEGFGDLSDGDDFRPGQVEDRGRAGGDGKGLQGDGVGIALPDEVGVSHAPGSSLIEQVAPEPWEHHAS